MLRPYTCGLSVLNWQKWWPPLGLEPPNVLYSTLRWIEKDNCLVSGFSQIPASPCALCTLLPFSSLHKNVSKVRRQPGEETFAVLALQKTLGLNISHSSPKITHPQKKKPKRQQCTFSFQEINHDLQGSLYLKLKHEEPNNIYDALCLGKYPV